MQDNPYEILQVSEKAEREVIEAAYRRLARKYHPDTNPQPNANFYMEKLNWAYELLMDPIKRTEYDFLSNRRNYTNQNPQDYSHRETQKEQNKDSNNHKDRTSHNGISETDETKKPKIKKPSIIKTISIAVLLLFGYYLLSMIVLIANYGSNKTLLLTLIIISLILSLVLARVATIGWNPNKRSIFRTILMLLLTFFPIFTWIPCFFASKVLSNGNLLDNRDWKLKTSIAFYGIASTLLAMYMFGDVFTKSEIINKPINYTLFDNSELGISFMYPDILEINTQTDNQRTDFGTIIKFSTILGVSNDPVLSIGIRIIEDPSRNIMFPELYPPDDMAIKLLVLGDITEIPLVEGESYKSEIENAYNNLIINSFIGFPSAEYKLSPLDTAIGDAVIYGILIISEKRDISIKFIASIEPNTKGSVSEEFSEEIWSEILNSIQIDY